MDAEVRTPGAESQGAGSPGDGSLGSNPRSACPEGSASQGTAEIVPCPDGPLLVRGDFEILTPDGDPVPRTRKTVALCRCGASGLKPFCDGTHKLAKFRSGD